MIQTENITINNTDFDRTYSDCGFYIERDGVKYSDAVDPKTAEEHTPKRTKKSKPKKANKTKIRRAAEYSNI